MAWLLFAGSEGDDGEVMCTKVAIVISVPYCVTKAGLSRKIAMTVSASSQCVSYTSQSRNKPRILVRTATEELVSPSLGDSMEAMKQRARPTFSAVTCKEPLVVVRSWAINDNLSASGKDLADCAKEQKTMSCCFASNS